MASTCLVIAVPPQATAQTKELERNTRELEAVRERIEKLLDKMAAERGHKSELATELEQTEKQIAEVATDLRALDTRLQKRQAAVTKTRKARDAAAGRLEKQFEALAAQIRAAYMSGRQDKIKLLLNLDDPTRLGRLLVYYDYLNQARVANIETLELQVAELQGHQAKLQEQTQALEQVRSQQQAHLDQLARTRSAREKTIAKLNSSLARQDRDLESLRADEKSIRALLEQLRQELANIPQPGEGPPFTELKGKLNWPLQGKVLASYGQKKAGGRFSWRGVWLAAAEGTEVRAVAPGRVVYVGWMHRYGLIVVLDHGEGWFSLYGHNQATTVRVGDWLPEGGVLARAGSSGGHSKSGVYFEIRKGRQAVNPHQWLAES